jgi:hypothetical protein
MTSEERLRRSFGFAVCRLSFASLIRTDLATLEELEDKVREHPDHYDAELLLRLYDLRREAKLRQARDWLLREFQAKTLEEFAEQYPPGSEKNAFFRMTASYWDMAASIVNHGLVKEEFFFESSAEFWIVWDKVKHLAPAFREVLKNPLVWKNLETLATKYEQWIAKQAPEALDTLRKRFQIATASKAG